MIFCNEHRLPENHDCPFDLRKKGKFLNSLDETYFLYQDALDFKGKELTVGRIYDFVMAKQMTKSRAIDLLAYFIENSNNSEIRKVSILAFKVLELKSDKAFQVLESCLLSDEEPEVKKTASKIIAHNFPKRSKDLLDWVSKHNKN
jgi:hypothetical protein